MKRGIKIMLALALGVMGLTGCGSKGLSRAEKIILPATQEATSMIEITGTDFATKVENKDSFIIMLGSRSCTSCTAFKPIINQYVADTGSDIYLVQSTVTSVVDYKYTPTLVIYKDGEVIFKEDPNSKSEVFDSYAGLKKNIEEYAIVAPIVSVSREQLSTKISNGDEFVIYYGWDKCGDCSYLYNNFLTNYIVDNENAKQLYYIETNEWRENKPSSKPVEGSDNYETDIVNWNNWIDFATEFQFVSYENGKVPTLQYYKDGVMQEMFVYFNDIATYTMNANKEYEMTITGSYFADNPYIGQKMLYSVYKDTVSKGFYDAKLKTFFDKYLKN